MANFKVEIKSKDMIKPSSETPNHLNTLQLSFIDQFAPPTLMPYIFYYQTPLTQNNNTKITATLLKNSLSQTLVQFYPLAGRIEGNSSINCNDEGAEFYEADVLATLAEVIANPDPEELIRLLPYPPFGANKSIVTAVQVNWFSCGGMAIGVSISHKIADVATSVAFINAWADNARGVTVSSNNHTKTVTFDSASFFPPMNLDGVYDPESVMSKEKIVTKRFIFDKEKLDELKNKCDNERLERPPTRVGVVTAFFWKKFIKIARAKPTPPKIFNVTQVVNLKTIKGSPIPENCYGNLFWSTFTHTDTEPETEYTEAVGKLRTALKKMDVNYLPKIKTGECLLELQKAFESFSQGEGDSCGITSLVSFPIYEIDFGWGTPIWVSSTALPFKNMVGLLPTKCGQGIEAWINVVEHDAVALEEDHDFRSLASS